jgi:hypothetical protein
VKNAVIVVISSWDSKIMTRVLSAPYLSNCLLIVLFWSFCVILCQFIAIRLRTQFSLNSKQESNYEPIFKITFNENNWILNLL